jgi:hypothetical protein
MDPSSAFNVFEAGLWATFAWLTAVFGSRVGGMTPRLRASLSASFLAFGISDLIECSTGAWWRPPGLLVYKGLCLLGIVGSYLAVRRNQQPAAVPSPTAATATAAVRRPRVGIAWVMMIIAIAALNMGAIRVVSDHANAQTDLLASGTLPMANLLAFGLLVGHRRHGSRSFLVGFEAFGALALAFYVASILSLSDRASFGQMIVDGYLWLDQKLWAPGSARTIPRVAIAASALSLWLTWPQLTFALLGGFLTRLTAPSRGAFPGGRRGGQNEGSCLRIG